MLLAVLRSRWAQAVAALFAATAIGVVLYGTWLYQQARSEECDTWPSPEPTMEELIDVRQRISDYQRDPAPDAVLRLSGDEVNALLGDEPELRMRIHLGARDLTARLAIPVEGGCYNVDFEGRLRVDSGVALVVPRHLVVGEVDLTSWLGGRGWRLRAEQLPDGRVVRLLANTRALKVEDGWLHVQLVNPWDVW